MVMAKNIFAAAKQTALFRSIKIGFGMVGGFFGNMNFLLDTPYYYFDKVDQLLPFLAPITSFVRTLQMIYKAIKSAIFSQKSTPRVAMKVILPLAKVGVTVLSIILGSLLIYAAAPVLLIAGCVITVANALWRLSTSIYDRFFGVGKELEASIAEKEVQLLALPNIRLQHENKEVIALTEDFNKLSKLNGKIAGRSHDLFIGILTIASATLCLTPFYPIGMLMLTSITLYSVATSDLTKALNLLSPSNPLKRATEWYKKTTNWYGRLIKNYNKRINPPKDGNTLYAQPGVQREVRHIAAMLRTKQQNSLLGHHNSAHRRAHDCPAIYIEHKHGNQELEASVARLFGAHANNDHEDVAAKEAYERLLGNDKNHKG